MIMYKQEFLSSAGLQVQTLDFWLEQRWLVPEQTATGEISPTGTLRVHI